MKPLLSTCAWAALAAVSLYPQTARGQAFQGVNETGNITRTPTSATTETIEVNSPRTVVNWRIAPTGNTFTFLPEGHVATFVNGDVGDYLVINRILSNNGTSPRVDFLGSVISRLNESPGGRVWFYAPGGILVGPNAVFDVGSLLLTANDPVEILNEFGYGTGSYRFTATPGSTASVINQGSITAAGSNAYVAMIAPRVTQAGTVRVDGSAAYVAAEQVDLTISGTLFDISVGIGSDADTAGGNTLEHTGTTITEEPESGYGSDPRGIVLVAVPKNNAVTMLVTGTLGYEEASSATLSGGRIILAAGYGASFNSVGQRAEVTNAAANVVIRDATFNAQTEGAATGTAIATATAGNTLAFNNGLSLFGDGSVTMRAEAGSTIDVASGLTLESSGNSGAATLEALAGSSITVVGDAVIDAENEDGTSGGVATVRAAGGTITIDGDLTVDAQYEGGAPEGAGGTALVEALDGGAIEVDGSLSAIAIGETDDQAGGGVARGGTATVAARGGTIDVGGTIRVDARGRVEVDEEESASGLSQAFGGTATLESSDQNGSEGSITSGGAIEVDANAGQNGPDSEDDGGPYVGDATGGTVNIVVNGGSLSATSLVASARGLGVGGLPESSFGGGLQSGYDGTGGTVNVTLRGTSAVIPSLTIDVRGLGGQGGTGENGGAGGIGRGGTANLLVEQGAPQLGAFAVDARGVGGAGGDADSVEGSGPGDGGAGGAGIGGTILLEAGVGGTLDVSAASDNASGQGGEGGDGSDNFASGNGGAGGDGGDGTGGTLEIRTTGGTITETSGTGLNLIANGRGGLGGQGGAAFDQGGTGGDGGDGGDGFGGTAFINVQGGTVTASQTRLESNGLFGSGGQGGTGSTPGSFGFSGFDAGGLSRILVTDANGVSGNASLGTTVIESQSFSSTVGGPADGGAGRVLIEDLGTVAGGLAFASLEVSAFGTPSDDGPGFELRSTEGPITTGDAVIRLLGDIEIEAQGSGGFQGSGNVFLDSNQTITISHLNPAADARTVSGAALTLRATGDIVGDAGSLVAATSGTAVVTGDSVTLGRISAVSDIVVESQTTIGIQSAIAGRDVSLLANGNINVAFAQAGDDFLADAGGSFTGGTVRTTGAGPDDSDEGEEAGAGGPTAIQGPANAGGEAGSNIEIEAEGDIVLATGEAFSSLTLTSANGTITSSQRLAAGDDVNLEAPGNIQVAFGQAGDDFNADTDANFIGGTIITTGVSGGLPGDTAIFFADFSSSEGLQLNGSAAVAVLNGRSVLRVTPATTGQAGSAFSTEAVPLDENFSFSTRFTINFNNFGGAGGGADGLVFVLQTVSNTAGTGGGGIGFEGLANSAGVEFDTFNNGGIDANNNNHVGLDLNGSVASTVLVPLTDVILNSGTDLTVYVDYNGATNQLEVRISDQGFRPVLPTLTAEVDLASVLGAPEAFVGFTSGTGSGFANHDVVNWEFRNAFSPVVAQNVGADINIRAGGNIDLGTASAAGDVTLASTAGTLIDASQINAAGAVDVQSPGTIAIDAVSAGDDLRLQAGGNLTVGFAQAGDDATIEAGGQLTADDVTATTGRIMASGAVGPVVTGDLRSRLAVVVSSTTGALTTGDIESTGGTVDLTALGDMTVGNVRSAGSIFLTGGGAITALNLTAGTGPLVGGGLGTTEPGIASGFDDFFLPRNDDGATGAIDLPFLINYFGQEYDQTFVSNNGYLTFNSPQGTFTPSGLGEDYSGQPIIAGFFADVDTTNSLSEQLTYGPGTYAGRTAFGATWNGVGYYSSQADKLNDFQIILVDRSDTGTGNFDIYFNYARITWETGSASGGVNGFGGVSAAVGYNAGTGNQPGTFFELPGSRVPGSFLDTGTMPLITGTNNGVPGQLAFQVRNGQVTPGVSGSGDIRVTNIAAGNTGDINLGNLDGANIDVDGANRVTIGSVNADGTVALSATNALTYVSSTSGAATNLAGLGIVGGATTTETDLVATAGANGITIERIDAGGDVQLESQGGDVLVSSDLIGGDRIEAIGRSVELNALGALSVALVNATGGNAEINSGGNLTLQDVAATANVTATSGATLAINGTISGQQIDLASTDISIAGAARIGTVAGTNLINIVANGQNGATVTLGGAAGGSGYRLDSSEFGGFAARNITFSSPIQGGTLRVEDLNIRGALAQNPNVTQVLSIESANDIEVVGEVALTNAGEDNELRFVAGNEFFADADSADISVTNGTALAGQVSIEAESIVIATQAAADETETLATIAERNERLGQNDGQADDDGYVRANGVVLSASERIWVQTSGASTEDVDRRGITTGSGGLTVIGTGDGPVEIIINGRQGDGAGGFTGGEDLIGLVSIEGEFAEGSTINGCLITGLFCGLEDFIETPPVQDVVQELFDDEEGEDSEDSTKPPLLRLGSLIRLLGYPFAPVVDEPVTGTGNEDQWQASSTQLIETPTLPEDEVIDQPVTGSGNEDRQDPGDED